MDVLGAVGRGRCKEMEQQSILGKLGRTFYTTQISSLGQCKFKNLGRVSMVLFGLPWWLSGKEKNAPAMQEMCV